MLAEGLDVFVWGVRRAAPRDALGARLAALWGVPPERLRYQMHLAKPSLSVQPHPRNALGEVAAEGGALTVGRVRLPIAPRAAPASLDGGGFALTRHALALMERVASCVRVDEPVHRCRAPLHAGPPPPLP